MQIHMNNKFLFFIIGILGGFAFPPFNVWFPLFSVVSLSIFLSYMLYLIDISRSVKQAFWRMFWLTEISYFISFSWILKPFSFLPYTHLTSSIFAHVGLFLFTVFLTLFIEFSAVLTYKVDKKYRYFIFALSIAFFEWVRGWIFTGFPWNQIALVWSEVPIVMQMVSLVGPYALTFLTVFVLSLPYLIFYKKVGWKNINVICVFFIILFSLVFGGLRFEKYSYNKYHDFKIRLIDANIPQYLVNSKLSVKKYLDLVKLDGWENIDLFVLPESSSPFDLTNNGYYQTVYSNMNNAKSSLIVGFNRYDNFDENYDKYDVYNSLAVIDRNGIQYIYDKKHLVPFGEYIPFKKIIPLKKFTDGIVDFNSGKHHNAFSLKNIKFLPFICYEIIFSGLMIQEDVDAIVNISNDAWFGEIGKYQHLEISKLRALEEGLPVVRVSNDGVSGGNSVSVISPLGILEDRIQYDKVVKFDDGSIVSDFVLPRRIERTFYSKTGNILFLIFCFISFFSLFLLSKKINLTEKK